MSDLTSHQRNKIRRIALAEPAPEGWQPNVGDEVFFQRRTKEWCNSENEAGFSATDVKQPLTLRSGLQVAIVASRMIDQDIVLIREPMTPAKKKIRQRNVLTNNLRPFRGWDIEKTRLPLKQENRRKVMKTAIQRYQETKKQRPDTLLLLRMGDFYELFYEDAETAARVLGLTLTTRDKASRDPVPMAGFPYHQLDAYLRKLVQAGFHASVCEQVEAPKAKK